VPISRSGVPGAHRLVTVARSRDLLVSWLEA
jgi:hypothetical protein